MTSAEIGELQRAERAAPYCSTAMMRTSRSGLMPPTYVLFPVALRADLQQPERHVASTCGSRGRPSRRSPITLRWICSLPLDTVRGRDGDRLGNIAAVDHGVGGPQMSATDRR